VCIATVYSDGDDERKEGMQDVIRIEAEDSAFRLVGLLGEEKHIEGRLKSVDFWQEHSAVIEQH
jgi:predicted RNA-binding protein